MLKICQKSNKIINKEGLAKNKYRNLAGPKVLCYHSVTLTSWLLDIVIKEAEIHMKISGVYPKNQPGNGDNYIII